jgi:hypothetical protein
LTFTPHGCKKIFLKEFIMTKKKKIIIGVVIIGVVAAWVAIGSVFGLGAGAARRNFGGMALSGAPGNTTIAVKDFEPLEMVFASAVGEGGASAEVYNLLLKEAQKVGGQGIINVRINRQWKLFGADTVSGSALAVKYTDSVGLPATDNSFGWGRW